MTPTLPPPSMKTKIDPDYREVEMVRKLARAYKIIAAAEKMGDDWYWDTMGLYEIREKIANEMANILVGDEEVLGK